MTLLKFLDSNRIKHYEFALMSGINKGQLSRILSRQIPPDIYVNRISVGLGRACARFHIDPQQAETVLESLKKTVEQGQESASI